MMNKTNLPQWKSVVTESVVYNPLTGNYTYTEQDTPDTYNEFWTPLGQPRTTGRMSEKITDKERSPRKEKKKPKKPTRSFLHTLKCD